MTDKVIGVISHHQKKQQFEACNLLEDVRHLNAPGTNLYPLLSVDFHTVGSQRSDGSVNDLVHHLSVAVGLLQLSSCDPDVAVSGDVLSSFIQDTAGILVCFKTG